MLTAIMARVPAAEMVRSASNALDILEMHRNCTGIAQEFIEFGVGRSSKHLVPTVQDF